jgi:hypothetical protein
VYVCDLGVFRKWACGEYDHDESRRMYHTVCGDADFFREELEKMVNHELMPRTDEQRRQAIRSMPGFPLEYATDWSTILRYAVRFDAGGEVRTLRWAVSHCRRLTRMVVVVTSVRKAVEVRDVVYVCYQCGTSHREPVSVRYKPPDTCAVCAQMGHAGDLVLETRLSIFSTSWGGRCEAGQLALDVQVRCPPQEHGRNLRFEPGHYEATGMVVPAYHHSGVSDMILFLEDWRSLRSEPPPYDSDVNLDTLVRSFSPSVYNTETCWAAKALVVLSLFNTGISPLIVGEGGTAKSRILADIHWPGDTGLSFGNVVGGQSCSVAGLGISHENIKGKGYTLVPGLLVTNGSSAFLFFVWRYLYTLLQVCWPSTTCTRCLPTATRRSSRCSVAGQAAARSPRPRQAGVSHSTRT